LHTRVRAIAEQLAHELQAAQRSTNGWKDEPCSDLLLDAALSTALAQLAATGCWGPRNESASRAVWDIADEWLRQGPLILRAREKPRGYAGDFELLGWIYDGVTSQKPLGRALDRYFLKLAAPQAVRARIDEAAAALTAHCLGAQPGAYRVLILGSGPARELDLALGCLDPARRLEVHATLLDLDPEALDAARTALSPWIPPEQIVTVRENLYRLTDERRRSLLDDPYDFIICLGFFDYLEPAIATATIRLLYQRLRPGGRLLIGNFAPHCPSRAFMEWIGNWYLIYRTAEEMAALAQAAEIPSSCFTITSEKTGCDLFIHARRPDC
jgi:extracellular factor (EF) 3-hydroxypalmitic acid methyl ester biosynthesis protein